MLPLDWVWAKARVARAKRENANFIVNWVLGGGLGIGYWFLEDRYY